MRHLWLALPVLATACTGGEITLEPPFLTWGEVDFQELRPDEGYFPQEVELRNTGSRALDIRLEEVDELHLKVGALLATQSPPTLPTLQPDSAQVITVAVWDYDIEAGERDTEVTGHLRLAADGMREPALLEWSFTPIRDIVVDTGR